MQLKYFLILTLILVSCDTSKIKFEIKNQDKSSPSQSLPLISIKNKNDLELVRNNLSGNYELSDNIDLSGVNWAPIGNEVNPFNGTFNGNGFKISNLSMSKDNVDHLGLFGVVGKNSVIRNLKLENFNLNNQKAVGTCNFQENYNADKFIGPQQIHCSAGGLAGFSQGVIDSVEILGASTIRGNANVGGLVGIVGEGYLHQTSSVALVEENLNANGGNFGGLVGYLRGMGAFVLSSYFRGTVRAVTSNNVGGLIGLSTGGAVFSYAVSDVSGNERTGLFIGNVDSGGKTRVGFSFASPVNADSNEGSFSGAGSEDALINVKFATFDPDNDGCINAANSNRCEEIALADIDQLKGDNFPYFDFVGTWNVEEGDFPTLKIGGVARADNPLVQFDGAGTFDDPYLIRTPQDFLSLNESLHYSGSYFKIENDLDFNGVEFNSIDININNKKMGFSGIIDGNNKTIRNVTYSGGSYTGVFSRTYGLLIKDLTFENMNFSVLQFSSVLTGNSSNLIFKNITFKDSILRMNGSRGGFFCAFCSNVAVLNSKVVNSNLENSTDNVGALVGLVSGEMYNGLIYRSSGQGNINGFNRSVGGLVGQKSSFGRIIESFSNVVINLNGASIERNGLLESGFRVGGMIGSSSHRDFVFDSYSLGQILSEGKVLVNGVSPKDYFIGGIVGSGHKFVHQNGFSFVNINLDYGQHCGGLSGHQNNTHQAVNFLSASYGKCGTEEIALEDGGVAVQDIPISYLGRGGRYATGNVNIVVRDYGSGQALCDNLDANGNPIESFTREVECQVVLNDDPVLLNRYEFRKSAEQNNLLNDLESFGWETQIWKGNDSGYPTLQWQNR